MTKQLYHFKYPPSVCKSSYFSTSSPILVIIWLFTYSWETAMATHSSTLAWKIPWTEEPGRLQSMRSLRVEHDWATSLSLSTFMRCRRKWQPSPVFLPGKSQGWGEPGGLPSMGPHRVGHNWSDLAAAAVILTLVGDILLWFRFAFPY